MSNFKWLATGSILPKHPNLRRRRIATINQPSKTSPKSSPLSFTSALLKLGLILSTSYFFIRIIMAFLDEAVILEEISAPSSLISQGYTSLVISRQLADEMSLISKNAGSRLENNTLLRSQVTDFRIPSVGLSVNEITNHLRSFAGRPPRTIAGEITCSEPSCSRGIIYLRIRSTRRDENYFDSPYVQIDDQSQVQVPLEQLGVPAEKIAELLAAAAKVAMSRISPIVFAGYQVQQRNMEAALAIYSKLSLIGDLQDRVWAFNGMGAVFAAKGHFSEAERAYRHAIALDRSFSQAHNNLGVLLRSQGDQVGAEKSYHNAIAADAKSASAYNNLGFLLRETKNDEDAAEEAFQHAILLEPGYARAHINLGLLFESQDRDADAERAYRRAIALGTNNTLPYKNLGNLLKEQNRREDAVDVYRQAINFNPAFDDIRQSLIDLLRELSRNVEADAFLAD